MKLCYMSAANKNKYYAVSFYYKNLDKTKISMGDFYVSL